MDYKRTIWKSLGTHFKMCKRSLLLAVRFASCVECLRIQKICKLFNNNEV